MDADDEHTSPIWYFQSERSVLTGLRALLLAFLNIELSLSLAPLPSSDFASRLRTWAYYVLSSTQSA